MVFKSALIRKFNFGTTCAACLYKVYIHYCGGEGGSRACDHSVSPKSQSLFSCEGAALEVLMYVHMSVHLSVINLKFSGSRRFLKVPESC